MADAKITETTEQGTTSSEPKSAESKKFVHYTGSASIRNISAADWDKAGIQGQEFVTWDRKSGNKLDKARFTDAALDLLRQDGNFEIDE